MRPEQVVLYSGVYMDAHWDRIPVAQRLDVSNDSIEAVYESQLSILAAHAPSMLRKERHDLHDLMHLAHQILLIMHVARVRQAPDLFTGLLGGGAFRGNRPLILVLHLLFEPYVGRRTTVKFHYPILSSRSSTSTKVLEQKLLEKTCLILEDLQSSGLSSFGGVMSYLASQQFSVSEHDYDLIF